jgi:hypothetical protein
MNKLITSSLILVLMVSLGHGSLRANSPKGFLFFGKIGGELFHVVAVFSDKESPPSCVVVVRQKAKDSSSYPRVLSHSENGVALVDRLVVEPGNLDVSRSGKLFVIVDDEVVVRGKLNRAANFFMRMIEERDSEFLNKFLEQCVNPE